MYFKKSSCSTVWHGREFQKKQLHTMFLAVCQQWSVHGTYREGINEDKRRVLMSQHLFNQVSASQLYSLVWSKFSKKKKKKDKRRSVQFQRCGKAWGQMQSTCFFFNLMYFLWANESLPTFSNINSNLGISQSFALQSFLKQCFLDPLCVNSLSQYFIKIHCISF